MTKPKAAGDLRQRGRKRGASNDLAIWVAVELRRRRLDLGRARGSTKRACEFVHQDLCRSTASSVTAKTVRNRFHRVERRRRNDPAYAERLDRQVDALDATANEVMASAGPSMAAVLLPLCMTRN